MSAHGQLKGRLSTVLIGLGLIALAMVTQWTSAAVAGSTDPELAIGEVVATAGEAGAVVAVKGSWAFDDILQVEFPYTLVVSQGEAFVFYRVGEPARSGTFAGLVDGLSIGEVPQLEAAASPDPAARFIHVSPHRILVALPPSIDAGAISTVGYVTVPGDGTILSNTVSTTLAVGGSP